MKTLGLIGKPVLNDQEKSDLFYLGQLIAASGNKLAVVPARGAADATRKGVEAEGGEVLELDSDVIGQSNHTIVYPDARLLARLRKSYPGIHETRSILVIPDGQLPVFLYGVEQAFHIAKHKLPQRQP